MLNKKLASKIFLLLILIGALGWIIFSPSHVLKSYQIKNSLKKVESSQVEAVVKPYLGQSFWRLNLDELHAQIVRLDWVYRASVTRHWPSQVDITIEEQQPVVRWGKDGLLNKNGDIFYPSDIKAFQNLVELDGDDSKAKQLLKDLVIFQKAFDQLGWTISRLVMNADNVWQIYFVKQPTVELDSMDWQHKLNRFIRAYPLVKEALRKNARLYDLRYSNGFAIKQNSETQQTDKTGS
jgi:cell division protein FtsQ